MALHSQWQYNFLLLSLFLFLVTFPNCPYNYIGHINIFNIIAQFKPSEMEDKIFIKRACTRYPLVPIQPPARNHAHQSFHNHFAHTQHPEAFSHQPCAYPTPRSFFTPTMRIPSTQQLFHTNHAHTQHPTAFSYQSYAYPVPRSFFTPTMRIPSTQKLFHTNFALPQHPAVLGGGLPLQTIQGRP